MSSRIVPVEYDAAEKVLRLAEPLAGVEDHAKFQATLDPADDTAERPWLALSGSLSKEAGESLAHAVDELFPPWK